ncbi:hypothetical protein [Collinsella sp. OM04-5]|uniref:hypothetical protein n=1 Tax=Collinsella sp. OM04-5 TaxID=2292326 RepID=UPI0011C100AE|nr:hypothetical protein [Collinsella sp. OM04-5]
MDRHSEPQQHKTAAEYRQAADEHVRTLKDFWKDFLVSGLFVLAAIVAIFACLAWFAANNRVSATGSTIGAKAERYTIAAASDDAAHVGYYERTDTEKQNIVGLDTTDAMTVTLKSNLNNETAGSLYPGARGKITFTVTPLVDDLNGITINLSRVLKAKGFTDDGIVADGTTLTEAQTLLGLIKGHLLFFTSCENGYYSGRVVDGKIEIHKSEFCKDGNVANPTNRSVPVTLYWVWPEYFQNFVLTGNTNYYKNLFAAEDASYADLKTDVENNKALYFYGLSGSAAAAKPYDNVGAYSSLYNNADEKIGNEVISIQLRITAQEGTTNG